MEEQHGLSSVPNIKYEPSDQSDELGQLKITNVFSIFETEPAKQSCEDLADVRRSLPKFGKKSCMAKDANDPAPDAPTSGRRYGLRKRNVKACERSCHELGVSSLVQMSKPKLKLVIPEGNPKSNDSDSRNQIRKQIVETYCKISAEPDCSPLKICEEKFEPVPTEGILSCDICSTVFFSVESLEEHVIEAHVVDNEFECTECTKAFISQDRLESHISEHVKEKETRVCSQCPICSKLLTNYKNQQQLKRHLLTHKAVKPFKCKLCPKSYAAGIDLKIHEMYQHGKPKPFKCPKCPNKSYVKYNILEDHLRTHSNDKTVVCENCHETFKTRQSLRDHRRRKRCDGVK